MEPDFCAWGRFEEVGLLIIGELPIRVLTLRECLESLKRALSLHIPCPLAVKWGLSIRGSGGFVRIYQLGHKLVKLSAPQQVRTVALFS